MSVKEELEDDPYGSAPPNAGDPELSDLQDRVDYIESYLHGVLFAFNQQQNRRLANLEASVEQVLARNLYYDRCLEGVAVLFQQHQQAIHWLTRGSSTHTDALVHFFHNWDFARRRFRRLYNQ